MLLLHQEFRRRNPHDPDAIGYELLALSVKRLSPACQVTERNYIITVLEGPSLESKRWAIPRVFVQKLRSRGGLKPCLYMPEMAELADMLWD